MKGAGPAEIARPLSILGVSALVILTPRREAISEARGVTLRPRPK
jgi:hypothetical protein